MNVLTLPRLPSRPFCCFSDAFCELNQFVNLAGKELSKNNWIVFYRAPKLNSFTKRSVSARVTREWGRGVNQQEKAREEVEQHIPFTIEMLH